MELLATADFNGYYLEDIKEQLGPERYEEFGKWYNGQTGAIHEGRLVVYQYDYERFLKHLPPLD
jgi:hypothetical protein